MTAHAHRAPHRPGRTAGGRAPARPGAREAGHGPEILLALSAVLVVLGGPVARTFTADVWLATGSTLLLATSIVLAALAARRLVRGGA